MHDASATILRDLNPEQRAAVEHVDGPVLVLAGAGSGKTRVITHRIAYMLATGVAEPRDVVAVTFTNKAAAEMRERVERLLGGSFRDGWVGTFHAFCLRHLRRYAERLGYRRDFVVYDRDDQLAVVRECLDVLQLGEDNFPPRQVLDRISRFKDRCQSAEQVRASARGFVAERFAGLYAAYQDRLRAAHAMDFDDLIVNVLRLRDVAPDAAERLARRCRYLLVDEYQDTNPAQYQLVRMLAERHGNVCAVGDEDQSIYRFRGADIANILRFEKDFPGARVIKLERNYRSTKTILAAADGVVERNRNRIGKRLWTDNAAGEPILLVRTGDERHEAAEVVRWLRAAGDRHGLGGCAVLYRTNAQSRALEEALLRQSIPYRIIGGLRFYQRREVKDVLAYARLLVNPEDDVALLRIVNNPPRGIGRATVEEMQARRGAGAPSLEAALRELSTRGELPGRATTAVRRFLDLVDGLREELDAPPSRLFETVLERTGYLSRLEQSREPDAVSRRENLAELVSAAAELDDVDDGLREFLDRVALVAETDAVQGDTGVTLMTLHCAKGLEFPAIAIVGLEENVFPHARSAAHDDDIEEERRLFYVGLTRAQKEVLVTHATTRRVFGRSSRHAPSRFLDEIPEELVQRRAAGGWADAGGGGSRWSGSEVAAASAAALSQQSVSPDAEDYDGVDVAPDGPALVGRLVRHPQFGVGTVSAATGEGTKLKLSIRFRSVGEKQILPHYTRLEVLARR